VTIGKWFMTDIVVKTGLIDHAAFERLLMSLLPDLAAEIDDEERSLLHMEMSAVARATCRAIENGDDKSIRCHFIKIIAHLYVPFLARLDYLRLARFRLAQMSSSRTFMI
jgi:hypothetical protein